MEDLEPLARDCLRGNVNAHEKPLSRNREIIRMRSNDSSAQRSEFANNSTETPSHPSQRCRSDSSKTKARSRATGRKMAQMLVI